MKNENKIDLTNLAKAVAMDFQNDKQTAIAISEKHDDYNKFKSILEGKIAYLLDNKFDYLVNVLYKIDVDEKKLKEYIPSVLTDLIIERELKKMKLREQYKTKKDIGKLDE